MINKGISGGMVHKIPADLKSSLLVNQKALEVWEGLTPLARNEWICWIEAVKKEVTRKEHIERTIRDLQANKRRPCCWYGCIHRKDKKISPSVQNLVINKK